MNNKYVLGVDAGGSKTEAAVADVNGKVLGIGTAGPGKIRGYPREEIILNHQTAVKDALVSANLPIETSFAASCFGLSALNRKDDLATSKDIVKAGFGFKRLGKLALVNDLRLIFREGINRSYGIALVAGTGSNIIGVNKNGDIYEPIPEYPQGVWPDPGSGKSIGRKAVELGIIEEKGDLDGGYSIASSLPAIDKMACDNNRKAVNILSDATVEIALEVKKAVDYLKMEKHPFEIICAGGVFKMKYPIKKMVEKKIEEFLPNATVKFLKTKPVIGAIKLAIDSIKSEQRY